MPDRSNRGFPLAAHSRARRRMISLQSTAEPSEPVPDIVSVDGLGNSEPDGSAPPVSAPDVPHFSIAGEPETSFDLPSTGFDIVPAQETSENIPVHHQELQRAIDFGPFKELIRGMKPATWVFTGDSITLGAQHTGGGRSYVEHFSERTRWELHRYHDAVINTAAPGDTSRSLLEDLEWRALRFRPDVVSVMIGVNDAAGGQTRRTEFRENLEFIVECARAEGALVLLHTPPHADLGKALAHADLRAYVRLIRDVARDLDVACVDHWAQWKKAAEENGCRGWLAADGIHPTAAGHRAMARLLFKRLGLLDDQSALCALLEK